jgi:adenylate cyclase
MGHPAKKALPPGSVAARARSACLDEFRRLAWLSLVGAAAFVAGGILGIAFGSSSPTRDIMLSGLHALFLALPLTGLERAISARPIAARLARHSFALVFGLRCLAYTGVAIASTALVSGITGASHAALSHIRPGSAASFAFSLLVAVTVNFVIMANRLLGPRVLLHFVDGRYHRPKNETRFVLFLDLVGSTSLGERLGTVDYHRLLNHFICDASQAVVETEGEIHEIVGDQIVVTWTEARGARRSQALFCALRIHAIIHGREEEYRQEFGIVPEFRSALHFGPVAVGEVGSVKQQIVMVGNTMNTTARIEGKCRETGEWYLISGPALRALSSPPMVRILALGTFAIRGRNESIDLFAVSVAAAPPMMRAEDRLESD